MVNWTDKHVLVIGIARQGVALGRYLARHGAHVVLNDKKPAEQLKGASAELSDLDAATAGRIEWVTGSHPITLLDGMDLVCISGGVPLDIPLVQEALGRGIPLSNDSQIFLEACPCRTIGITGSAGKTTTTSLVGSMAHRSVEEFPGKPYRKAWVGGNIGAPLIAEVDEMQPDDLAVMELSSFQLELMTQSVNIACVLNITPNHLDRHASMEAYTAAKQRILEFQTGQDVAILGQDDPGAWALLDCGLAGKLSFGRQKPPQGMQGSFIEEGWVCLWDGKNATRVLRLDEIRLRGWHNVENVLAACAIGMAAGLPLDAMRQAALEFNGVPHRLEWVRTWQGADWYNDSIATAPERVVAGIHAFDTREEESRPIILLAGGRDKNLPWDELAGLIHSRVEHLVLFGEASAKIAQAVGGVHSGNYLQSINYCAGLEQAVKTAASVVEPGDIVLLAPGGTSFDEFRDFEERGEAFKRWVSNLV